MPKPAKGPRLGSGPAHERLMLANLATALFEHGRIRTTETKARRLRPVAERLITFAKRGDLHARRQVLSVVRDKQVVTTLFDEIGPRYAERLGGYTRILKVGPRKGDNAPMAIVELVEGRTVEQEVVGEAERARGTRFRRRPVAQRRLRKNSRLNRKPQQPSLLKLKQPKPRLVSKRRKLPKSRLRFLPKVMSKQRQTSKRRSRWRCPLKVATPRL